MLGRCSAPDDGVIGDLQNGHSGSLPHIAASKIIMCWPLQRCPGLLAGCYEFRTFRFKTFTSNASKVLLAAVKRFSHWFPQEELHR